MGSVWLKNDDSSHHSSKDYYNDCKWTMENLDQGLTDLENKRVKWTEERGNFFGGSSTVSLTIHNLHQ